MSIMIAVLLLTSAAQEACVTSFTRSLRPMDAHLAEAIIMSYLTEIRSRLEKAARIGRAADACASAAFHENGIEVALAEQVLHEATTLLNGASLISRIARQS